MTAFQGSVPRNPLPRPFGHKDCNFTRRRCFWLFFLGEKGLTRLRSARSPQPWGSGRSGADSDAHQSPATCVFKREDTCGGAVTASTRAVGLELCPGGLSFSPFFWPQPRRNPVMSFTPRRSSAVEITAATWEKPSRTVRWPRHGRRNEQELLMEGTIIWLHSFHERPFSEDSWQGAARKRFSGKRVMGRRRKLGREGGKVDRGDGKGGQCMDEASDEGSDDSCEESLRGNESLPGVPCASLTPLLSRKMCGNGVCQRQT